MENKILYGIEFVTVLDDDEKEMSITQNIEFTSMADLVNWAKKLKKNQFIKDKYKIQIEKLDLMDNHTIS